MTIKSARFFTGKKIAGLILAVLVLGTILFLAFFGKKNTTPKLTLSQAIANQDSFKRLNQDSDKDGLKDWEEIIYHTDPHNPDTDGDGTPDGEEVRLGRNPLVPGPNDYIASTTPLASAPIPQYSFDNLTQRLAAKIGETFVIPNIANPNATINPSVGQDLVNETLATSPQLQIYVNEKDLLISNYNSKEAIQKYDKETSAIFQQVALSLVQSPLEIFSQAIQNDDLSTLSSLDKYISTYDQTAQKLKKITVPAKLASFHAGTINVFMQERDMTQKMRAAEKDIVSAIMAAQNFQKVYQEIKDLMDQYNSAINGIN